MKNPDRRGDLEEIFEILVTSYSQKGGALPPEGDLCWRPATDVYETETELVVTVDIAGMNVRDISVLADGDVITIRGVRQEISPRCKKQFHKMEIQVGPFQRSINVPVPIDLQSLSTTYANGLLEVRVKRVLEPRTKRSVEVE